MMSTAPQAPARVESGAGRAEGTAPPEQQPVDVAAGGTGGEPSAAAAEAAVEGPADVLPSRAAWTAAADAGAAIGRGSAAAGVATAGFFDRLGRRIAGAVTP
jgi:hypothetical protein